jgi:hypothetical protein
MLSILEEGNNMDFGKIVARELSKHEEEILRQAKVIASLQEGQQKLLEALLVK